MDEARVADIDADMGVGLVAGIEEYQVAGFECVAFDLDADGAEFTTAARQVDAHDLAEYMVDQTAAIEPLLGGVAAPLIRGADQTGRVDRHIDAGERRGLRGRKSEAQQTGQQESEHGVLLYSERRGAATRRYRPGVFNMNDQQHSTAPEATDNGGPLAIIEYAASGAAAAPDIRAQVKQLVTTVLDERRLSLGELRAALSAIAAGVGSGVSARGGDLRTGLKAAVDGMDEALGEAARATGNTLKDAAANGREFREGELAESLERLKSLESEFVSALGDTAKRTGGRLADEYDRLAEEFRASGGTLRGQVGQTMGELRDRLKDDGHRIADDLRAGASEGKSRLSQAASGLLEALAEKLQRESDRLRA